MLLKVKLKNSHFFHMDNRDSDSGSNTSSAISVTEADPEAMKMGTDPLKSLVLK